METESCIDQTAEWGWATVQVPRIARARACRRKRFLILFYLFNFANLMFHRVSFLKLLIPHLLRSLASLH